jgi:diguanylate cyclase (GGDEF)-like protein
LTDEASVLIPNSTDVESALYEITEVGISSDSMDDYYAKIHEIIGRLTYAKNFFIALYDQEENRVEFVYFVDEVDTDLSAEKIGRLTQDDLRKTATGYLLKTGKMAHLLRTDFISLEKKGIIDSHGALAFDWLGVPLRYKDELLGAMVIQSYDPEITYAKKEEDILQFISRQIALLIKSKLAEQKLVESNRLLENRVVERTESLNLINQAMGKEIEERKKSENIQAALFRITDLVSTSASLDDFFLSVHKVIEELMYAKNEYVALLSDDHKYIEFLYHVDQQDQNPIRRKMKGNANSGGLTEKILLSGDVILFNRHEGDKKAVTGANCASYLGVPLQDGKRTFGVLAVQSYDTENRYDKSHKNILITIGKQIATAILRKKDSDSLRAAHENLERRVKERTFELEDTIVKRRKIERQLEHDSLHDALTGLPNRLFFSNELDKMVEQHLKRSSLGEMAEHGFAVLFLDLDRFKLINDSLGHHVGDLFLIEVANRLQHCLRSGDIVARLGGDEFCILMSEISSELVAVRLAIRILKDLKSPISVQKHSLITSASIGIRLCLEEQGSANEIMSDADAAMYEAKHQGKNCYCLFDSEIKDLVKGRVEIEHALREALNKGELYLDYQPVVELTNGRIVGCEALVRWNHPEKGMIPPDKFIPIAEETGLIVELGEFVASQAAEALVELGKSEATKDFFVNINVSAVQILAQTFDEFMRHLIDTTGIKPSLINVEITESILIEDFRAALSFVRELKSMGINIYLDDFGTGFSSLSYLHQFPFDVIKLDKSFIDEMQMGTKKLAIVESIAAMAKNLKMKIVAEGVETEEQRNVLNEYHYPIGQGYLFSKPIALEQFSTLVEEQTKQQEI